MLFYDVTERKWLPEDCAHEHDVDMTQVAFGGSPPDDCMRFFGLYLDGAVWNAELACLQDSGFNERFTALPEVKILVMVCRV